ncbi:MAG TPA: histidinol-phosphate transaminase [Candidatus Binatia bacterium]|jgi:histidinol-phosphate aminotransferase
MAGYFRPNIDAMTGYVPGEQLSGAGIIKLNTNENPYPPSPRVLSALRQALNSSLRLYPESLNETLRSAAAAVYGVKRENILAGNGSDEILSIIMRCFVGAADRVAMPVPTYSLYDTLITIQEGQRVSIDYPPDFTLPEQLYSQNAAVTFLCNPNSPSGTLVGLEDIDKLARSIPGILVVDEAYIDFAATEGASVLPLLGRLPNLIVLRTFSKSFSLAGMRVGLAFAAEEIIAGMNKVKDSYNLNRLSAVAATAALKDLPWMTRNVRRVQTTRRRLTAGLRKLGYHVFPSHANFVLAKTAGRNAGHVYESLKTQKILVRYFDTPGLSDALRISVGTPAEVRRLLEAMEQIHQNRAYMARPTGPEEKGDPA